MDYKIGTDKEFVIKKKKKIPREQIAGVLFSLPVILGFILFILGPVTITFIISFFKYTIGVSTKEFVGISNYYNLFSGKDIFFYPAVKATFNYVFLSVPAGVIFSFFVAVLLNNKIKGHAFFRGVFYLPVVIPLVASSMVWMWLLQPDFGFFNHVLRSIGLSPSLWLASEETVIPTLVLFSLWLTGTTIIIFLAGLKSVPRQLYESIQVDGGNIFHKLFHITIPMMTPIIFFNTVIGFANGIQTFVQPFIMTGGSGAGTNYGSPNSASLLYVLNLYREAFRFSSFGNASSQAVILFIVIIIFTAIFFKLSKSIVYYEGR